MLATKQVPWDTFQDDDDEDDANDEEDSLQSVDVAIFHFDGKVRMLLRRSKNWMKTEMLFQTRRARLQPRLGHGLTV